MNQEIQQLNIKDQILKKIESGEIHMKSKAYFVFRLGLLAVLIFLIFIVSTFLLSLVIFSINTNGNLFLLGFGAKGFYDFLLALPWFLLIINIGLILFLDQLLKSFKFGYKSSIMYLFIVTFIFITILSTLINLTSFHGNIAQRAQDKNLPLGGNGFYEGMAPRPYSGTFKGTVLFIEENTFDISYTRTRGASLELAKVVAMPNIEVGEFLKIGDTVFVAGTLYDGNITAYGIKKLN